MELRAVLVNVHVHVCVLAWRHAYNKRKWVRVYISLAYGFSFAYVSSVRIRRVCCAAYAGVPS